MFKNNNELIEHLKLKGISDPQVIEAMVSIDRKLFVPHELKANAYEDCPLPIEEQQTISQPYIVAYMTQALNLKKSDTVLEIGTGSGYQTAILSKLVKYVFSIELKPSLSYLASKHLKKLGIENVDLRVANGYQGLISQAPFDAIIVTAAPEILPEELFNQLAENGRLCAPVGEEHTVQSLNLYIKQNNQINKETLMKVIFVPMIK